MTSPTINAAWPALPPAKGAIDARGWLDAPPVLDALLALCEPPGWDLSPPQRLGRRNACTNAMRLWGLIEQIGAEPDAHLQRLEVLADSPMWDWNAWRFAGDVAGSTSFRVLLKFGSGDLRFDLQVQHTPDVLRKLQVRREHREGLRGELSAHWTLQPAAVPMAYPQARAFIAALVFSTTADQLEIGSPPEPSAAANGCARV